MSSELGEVQTVKIDYIAKDLTPEEQERLLSRMAGKSPKHLKKEKLTIEEARAIQFELEHEQLQEWRKNMTATQKKANKLKLNTDEKSAKTKTQNIDMANLVKDEPVADKAPVGKQ